jgi:hypothetical protein
VDQSAAHARIAHRAIPQYAVSKQVLIVLSTDSSLSCSSVALIVVLARAASPPSHSHDQVGVGGFSSISSDGIFFLDSISRRNEADVKFL